jgi:uncharacterized protein (DUF302 family)
MNKLFCFSLLVLLLVHDAVWAENSTVFEVTVNKPMSQVYPNMLSSIDESRFYLFFELNIGKNLSNFSEKWGDDYNQSGLSAIRSIVFCNGWYANQVSNKDPKMLGLCPLHITLIEKDGKTTALFNRPTVTSKSSPAHEIVVKIEQEVIKMIKNGMQ